MKAVLYNKRFSSDKFVYREIDRSVLNDDEILIKIRSVSLNAAKNRGVKGVQMDRTIKFLKDAGVFYVATVNGDKPRVRPFGAVCKHKDGSISAQTTKKTATNK
ncbi:hypothetical protein JXA84_08610 [candidate division WOR-3 bacterium]|nr:hypothetical protein [candidate division WOR-3 bacterium]